MRDICVYNDTLRVSIHVSIAWSSIDAAAYK